MSELKKTVLNDLHIELGAKMVPFANWNMPVQYPTGIIKEHNHTRNEVAIFDITHMGEFVVKGSNAADDLDKLMPRSVSLQKVGTCRYNFLLTDKGTVIDDLIIYRIKDDEFFIVVNAGTRDNDAKHIKAHLSDKTTFIDSSDDFVKIDLQGPKSPEVLIKLGLKKEEFPGYYKWTNCKIEGTSCILSRTGYTGERGFELYIDKENGVKIWNLLITQDNILSVGLGARDTLRLEMGYPLYGHEMNEDTTPIEAGFGKMFKLDTKREFIGKEALIESSKQPKKKLIAIEFDGRRAAREGSKVFFNEKEIGIVTSGAFSPSLNKAIALAMVDGSLNINQNDKIICPVGRKEIIGSVTTLPFYTKGSVK